MRKGRVFLVCLGVGVLGVPTWAAAQLFVSADVAGGQLTQLLSSDPLTRVSVGVLDDLIGKIANGGIVVGPDQVLYVSNNQGYECLGCPLRGTAGIIRYDLVTRSVLVFETGRVNGALALGPDGSLYVHHGTGVARYNRLTGAFIDFFVPIGSTGDLWNVFAMTFGPDGHLYIANSTLGGLKSEVLRYNGTTGAFLGAFVRDGSGGLRSPTGLAFGPGGHLYVNSLSTNQILRYNGQTGAFIDAFVPAGRGGLSEPWGLVFGSDGRFLFVASHGTGQILRYEAHTGAFRDVYAPNLPSRALTQSPEFDFAALAFCRVNANDVYMPGDERSVFVAIASYQSTDLKVAVKLWLDTPTKRELKLSVPADSPVRLPAKIPVGFKYVWEIPLNSTLPRGFYRAGCRVQDPLSGKVHAQSIRSFTIR